MQMTKRLIKNAVLAAVAGAALAGFATGASAQVSGGYDQSYYYHQGQFGSWRGEDGYVAVPMVYGRRYMRTPAQNNACKSDALRDPARLDYSRC
jgi:hypothetical protein